MTMRTVIFVINIGLIPTTIRKSTGKSDYAELKLAGMGYSIRRYLEITNGHH